MDIFMRNIGILVTKSQLKITLANVLHDPDYARHRNTTVMPINLEVTLHRKKPQHRFQTGILTVPTVAIGTQFLVEHGGLSPHKRVIVAGTSILFTESNKPARPHIVEELRRMPYEDPRIQEQRNRRIQEVSRNVVSVGAIQFGWECRDNVFSIEWEKEFPSTDCELVFDEERREFRMKHYDFDQTFIVAFRASQIRWVSAEVDRSLSPPIVVIFIFLAHAPMFESESASQRGLTSLLLQAGFPTLAAARQRMSAFDSEHSLAGVAAYTSCSMRLVCRASRDLQTFRQLCNYANTTCNDFVYPVERRGRFAPDVQSQYRAWLLQLPWPVAFQVEALALSLVVDLREILELQRRIESLRQGKGDAYVIAFLMYFGKQASLLYWYSEDDRADITSIGAFFTRCVQDYAPVVTGKRKRRRLTWDTFECLHVTVTPTKFRLHGPYPERSNRIMRQYPDNHDSFLRVVFVDETDLQYRFDRDVDGHAFIQRRVGTLLKDGLTVGERRFEFLAYSQSALKEHAVWFVKPFMDKNRQLVNARTIIERIGTFGALPSDPRLLYCPARYAARISQAFTATDSSFMIQPEEIIVEDDIKDPTGKWTFTDGVGTISPEVARDIWRVQRNRRRRAGRAEEYPRAFQIRFQGSKGVVSVNYRLSGRIVVLRPSMIKFSAPASRDLEIARSFYRPGPFYLNRPLIMVLEALGVPYEVFQRLQKDAVKQAEQSVESLEKSARLLETFGLGASFRLTSVMLSLHKLGVGPLGEDDFWSRMMAFAIHHVLRELKHHARIPVPEGWNVVGVADIHGYLKEGEIFCHLVLNDGREIYFDGPTLVSRSPTIHPGDVQVAHAIGRPPPGSPFAHESLRNTLVFSTKGARPLPSYLGGGDLDGDEYRVTMVESLRPTRTWSPANYDAAPRKYVDHISTVDDVADFITEYITSDCLGIVASTWLMIADQSSENIFDADCLRLSNLHSDAVDYPKSGQPVDLQDIPRLKFKQRPDWSAPETVADSKRFYKSERAIGRLFRDIRLPATAREAGHEQRHRHRDQAAQEQVIDAFHRLINYEDDSVPMVVAERVSQFIGLGRHEDDLVAEVWELYVGYVSELTAICVDHTLSYEKNAMLTEEEVVIGSIVAPCSQPRRRRDNMSHMREQATVLVDGVRDELEGEEGTLVEKSLERAWVAYRLAEMEGDAFGAKSFAWVALGVIFEAIKEIEEDEGYL